MRNLFLAICAFFTIGCVVAITGCGGGGGGNGINDPPPGKSLTLYGNVTIESDGITNPVVVMYSDSTHEVMFQTKIAGTKGVHPYKLVIPAGQPVDKYRIALYDWQGGGSVIDGGNEKNVLLGAYRYAILHLNAVQVYGAEPVDTWCAIVSDPGPKPWEWGLLQIAKRDITNQSLDFSTF